MNKLLSAFVGCAVVALGVYFAFTLLASPEKKIRWRLQEMAEDFNLARPGPCSRGLADGFRDETAGVGKEDIRLYLTHMTLTERDKETKKFLHRVTLPEDEMTIEVDAADPTKAHVDLVAAFEKLTNDEWSLYRKVSVSADFINGDDGWQVQHTTHEMLEGKRFR